MRIGDSEDESSFRAELRTWLSEQIPSGAPQSWSSDQLRAWSRSLYQAGYAGLSWPLEHGGRGLPPAYQAIYAEESARAGAPDHVNVIGLNMVGPTIIRYGSQEQQAAFLPRILSGETIFCQGFSEPDAGSDLAAVRTRAKSHPGGYRVDGEKVWSSYAHLADYCLLLVRTDPEAVKHRGLTCLLMDMRAPGVQVRPLRELSGDTDFNQIILTDV
jgi:alkylation response protein AidB-like acyl-CoA dehydrogenase